MTSHVSRSLPKIGWCCQDRFQSAYCCRTHRQNLIIRSLAHFRPSQKISYKSFHNFLCKAATDKHTDKQTRQTNASKNRTSYLGGGNKYNICTARFYHKLSFAHYQSLHPHPRQMRMRIQGRVKRLLTRWK